MSLNELVRRLRFLPLGLLWGLVASSLLICDLASRSVGFLIIIPDLNAVWRTVELVLVPIIGSLVGSCLTAGVLGTAMLSRDVPSTRWVVNWVKLSSASCAGGASIFILLFLLRALDGHLQWMQVSSWDDWLLYSLTYVVIAVMGSLGFGVVIGFVSAVVALVLAPLSLLGRRLILRHTSAAEPAGGASQAQP